MAYNKFIKKDGTVMLDLTDTTVSAETLAKDIIAVDKSGNKIVGTLTDSPLPIEISTEEEMAALLETGEIGSVYKYVGTSGTYENNALYELTEEESDPLQGTWVWNNTLTFPTNNVGVYMDFNFYEDDVYLSADQILLNSTILAVRYHISTAAAGTLYNAYTKGWKSSAAQTIDITFTYEQLVSRNDETKASTFLSLLQANATKQPSKTFAKLILQSDLEEITITENGEYEGEYSKVTVNVESGGSAEFNIAYGDTEPTDTSKLWVKASEPNEVQVKSKPVFIVDDLQTGIASLPTAAYNIAVASVGTNIYLFGGNISDGRLNTINVFNTETNSITTLDVTLPTIVDRIGVASVGTNIYLFGGYGNSDELNTINVFNTETNTITTLGATLPTAAREIGVASVGTNIYLFGGRGSNGRLNTINVFNTETNSITTLDVTLPTNINGICAASVGTNIYLFGGYSGSKVNTINVFNTETNSITTLDVTLPSAANYIGVASVGTNIYLFGGYEAIDKLNTINVFNTETNTITTLDVTLPTSMYGIGAASVGTNIYLFGGRGSSILNTINKFILVLSLPTNNILIESTVEENYFDILPNFEIGVKNVYRGNDNNNAELVSAALYKNGAWTDI